MQCRVFAPTHTHMSTLPPVSYSVDVWETGGVTNGENGVVTYGKNGFA